ncbi:Golgi-body localisation protein domain [Striga asiatica]|uniref:Golgi-body localisation protein domain n=1 Tax=Striga asiatica TaxID=4170 RepID=A0A5A7PA76_STRAF|nr:Golgi-body localisation protein domain [Striga asiatica]
MEEGGVFGAGAPSMARRLRLLFMRACSGRRPCPTTALPFAATAAAASLQIWGGGSKAPQQIKKRGNGNTHPTRDEIGISGEDTAFPVWICSGGVGDLTAGLEVEFCSPSPVAACGLDSASAAAEAEPTILVERWSRRSHAGAAGVEWSGAATCERARAIASVRGGRVRGTGVGEQEDEHISRLLLPRRCYT